MGYCQELLPAAAFNPAILSATALSLLHFLCLYPTVIHSHCLYNFVSLSPCPSYLLHIYSPLLNLCCRFCFCCCSLLTTSGASVGSPHFVRHPFACELFYYWTACSLPSSFITLWVCRENSEKEKSINFQTGIQSDISICRNLKLNYYSFVDDLGV